MLMNAFTTPAMPSSIQLVKTALEALDVFALPDTLEMASKVAQVRDMRNQQRFPYCSNLLKLSLLKLKLLIKFKKLMINMELRK